MFRTLVGWLAVVFSKYNLKVHSIGFANGLNTEYKETIILKFRLQFLEKCSYHLLR